MTFIRNKQTNMLQSILEVNTYYVWPNLPSGSLISTALHNFRRPHARPHCNTNFRALFSFWFVQCVYIVTCVLVDQKTIWVSLKIGHASNFPVLCHFFLRLNVHVKLYYPYSGESQSIYLTPLPHHFFGPSSVPRLGMTDDFLASHKVAVEEVELWADLSSGCDLPLLVDLYIYIILYV